MLAELPWRVAASPSWLPGDLSWDEALYQLGDLRASPQPAGRGARRFSSVFRPLRHGRAGAT